MTAALLNAHGSSLLLLLSLILVQLPQAACGVTMATSKTMQTALHALSKMSLKNEKANGHNNISISGGEEKQLYL